MNVNDKEFHSLIEAFGKEQANIPRPPEAQGFLNGWIFSCFEWLEGDPIGQGAKEIDEQEKGPEGEDLGMFTARKIRLLEGKINLIGDMQVRLKDHPQSYHKLAQKMNKLHVEYQKELAQHASVRLAMLARNRLYGEGDIYTRLSPVQFQKNERAKTHHDPKQKRLFRLEVDMAALENMIKTGKIPGNEELNTPEIPLTGAELMLLKNCLSNLWSEYRIVMQKRDQDLGRTYERLVKEKASSEVIDSIVQERTRLNKQLERFNNQIFALEDQILSELKIWNEDLFIASRKLHFALENQPNDSVRLRILASDKLKALRPHLEKLSSVEKDIKNNHQVPYEAYVERLLDQIEGKKIALEREFVQAQHIHDKNDRLNQLNEMSEQLEELKNDPNTDVLELKKRRIDHLRMQLEWSYREELEVKDLGLDKNLQSLRVKRGVLMTELKSAKSDYLKEVTKRKFAVEEKYAVDAQEESRAIQCASYLNHAMQWGYDRFVGVDDHFTNWKSKDWGRLLVEDQNGNSYFSLDFVKSLEANKKFIFETRISLDAYKKEKREKIANGAPAEEIETLNGKIRAKELDLADARVGMRGMLLERMTQAIGQRQHALKKNPANKQQIQDEIIVLEQGFDRQLLKYKVTERPKRNLAELIGRGAREVATEALSFGYLQTRYITPDEFESKREMADLGYNMNDELSKLFASMNDIEDVTKLVGEFLVWSDKHPEVAAGMAADIAIALNVIQQNMGGGGLVQMFSHSIDARLTTLAALGAMGRDHTPITEADLKFQALADLARWAPMATQLPAVLTEFFRGMATAGVAGGVAGGLKQAVVGSVQTAAVQRMVKGMQPAELRAAGIVARMANGYKFSEILEAERNLIVLEASGTARQAIMNPVKASKKGIELLKREFRLFKEVGTNQKVARVFAQVVLPMVTIAGAITAGLLLASPIGLVATLCIVFGIATAGFGGTSLLTMILDHFAKDILKRWREEDFLKIFDDNAELKEAASKERDKFMRNLEWEGQLPARQAGFVKPLPEKDDLTAYFKIKFDQVLSSKKAESVEKALTRDDLVKIWKEVAESKEMAAKIDEKAKDTKYAEKLRVQVMSTLLEEWFKPNLDQVIKGEFCKTLSEYGNEKEYQRGLNKARDEMKPERRQQRMEELIAEVRGMKAAAAA